MFEHDFINDESVKWKRIWKHPEGSMTSEAANAIASELIARHADVLLDAARFESREFATAGIVEVVAPLLAALQAENERLRKDLEQAEKSQEELCEEPDELAEARRLLSRHRRMFFIGSVARTEIDDFLTRTEPKT